MTIFESHASLGRPDLYTMRTALTMPTIETVKTFSQFGGESVTHGLVQAISAEKWYRDCRAAGGLPVALSTDRVELLKMPEASPIDEDEQLGGVTVDIVKKVKDAIEHLTDPENQADLAGYWQTSVSFFSELCERQLAGAKFYGIYPGDNIYDQSDRFKIENPFLTDSRKQKSRALRWPWTRKD